MLLTMLAAGAIQGSFLDNYKGIWADLSGQVVAVETYGIHFARNGKYYEISDENVKINTEGDYYVKWKGSKNLRTGNSNEYSIPYNFFYVPSADTLQLEGDGFLKLGRPNSSGVINNVGFSLKRTQGGSLLEANLTYICPNSKVRFDGKYKDDLFNLELTETLYADLKKDAPKGSYFVGGSLETKVGTFVIKGHRRGLAGYVNLINTKTNATEGTMYLVWQPTPDRVRELFNADSATTDNMEAFIKMPSSYPNGTLRNLKRG